MSDQNFRYAALEQVAVQNKSLNLRALVVGSATEASITKSTTGGAQAFIYLAAQSLTAPSGSNFSGLTSTTAPSVFGVYINVGGQARCVHRADIASIRSASMTAGVVTLRGAASAISGSTGVTADGNIAFTVSATAAAFNVALSHEFSILVEFDAQSNLTS
jgi:hypothetical protein